MATSGGRERVRELAPVVVVQSRVRLDEERLLLIFSSVFVVVGAGIWREVDWTLDWDFGEKCAVN